MIEPIEVAWAAGRDPGFIRGVLQMCYDLHWPKTHPSYFMACSGFESGHTWAPDVKNQAGSGAVGLIQFMPATAAGLGTTVENLELLSATDQLYYVGQYFRPYAARIHTLSDMYLSILLPKYVGASDSAVLFSGGVAYRQNSGLDSNHDGQVTKGEAAARVQQVYDAGMQPPNVGDALWNPP